MSEATVLILIGEALTLILLGGICIFAIFQLISLRTAPYVPSKQKAIEALLSIADIKQGTRLVDLGSGMGDICFAAAQQGAVVIGVELNPMLVWLSRLRTPSALRKNVSFIRANLYTYTLPAETDIVALYLLPHTLPGVWDKLKRELRPGSRVISNAFPIRDIEPDRQVEGARLYLIP